MSQFDVLDNMLSQKLCLPLMTCKDRYCSSVKLVTGQILYFSDEETPFLFCFLLEAIALKMSWKISCAPRLKWNNQSLTLAKAMHCLPCNDNLCNEMHILVTFHYLKLFWSNLCYRIIYGFIFPGKLIRSLVLVLHEVELCTCVLATFKFLSEARLLLKNIIILSLPTLVAKKDKIIARIKNRR